MKLKHLLNTNLQSRLMLTLIQVNDIIRQQKNLDNLYSRGLEKKKMYYSSNISYLTLQNQTTLEMRGLRQFLKEGGHLRTTF